MINALLHRLQSIDVFRAVTMFLMIFVNDVSGVKNIPAWIDHADGKADAMGFADIIFPAFLFIVGLSLPFAINNRIKKGSSTVDVLWYIIARSAALIIMGFFHVNLEGYSEEAALLSKPVWEILITVAFFLIWMDYPKAWPQPIKRTLSATGVMMLILLGIIYKGGDVGDVHGMQPGWWGILGIIGWAYLVCSVVFVLLEGKLSRLVFSLTIFLGINIATHAGLMPFSIGIIGDASSVTLIMGGVLISVIYSTLMAKNQTHKIWMILIASCIVTFIAAIILRPYTDGISKIRSTPAWVLICISISIAVFAGVIYVVDVRMKKHWFKVIAPAGTSTLTCYLIPYLLYSIFQLINFQYPDVLNTGYFGILRSFAVSFAVIAIAGLAEKIHVRLKV